MQFKERKPKMEQRAKRLVAITAVMNRAGISSLDEKQREVLAVFRDMVLLWESMTLRQRCDFLVGTPWASGVPLLPC